MTNAKLRSWYARYNRKYFGGKLPKVHVRFAEMHFCTFGMSTYFGGAKTGAWAVIEVAKHVKYWPKFVRCVLLHEMVHVSLPQKIMHGERFERGMRRLAKAGAFRGIW